VIHTLFRDAAIEELIPSNPCILSSKELGPNGDKDPEWRASAVYDRDEFIKVISSDQLPSDPAPCTPSWRSRACATARWRPALAELRPDPRAPWQARDRPLVRPRQH
jgi:hypothetical protein